MSLLKSPFILYVVISVFVTVEGATLNNKVLVHGGFDDFSMGQEGQGGRGGGGEPLI